LSGLKKAGSLAELRHHVDSAQEILDFIAGYLGKGSYPIMSSVGRGTFTSLTHTVTAGDTRILKTTLAVSAASTKFPNISLKITRSAMASTDPKNPVYSQLLPWFDQPTNTANASPQTTNTFTDNAAYVIADSTSTGHSYTAGAAAINNVIADTSQMPAVNASIKAYCSPDPGINAELAEAPDPTCSDLGSPTTASTICWVFEDGRP
jgi:hypothetical protein